LLERAAAHPPPLYDTASASQCGAPITPPPLQVQLQQQYSPAQKLSQQAHPVGSSIASGSPNLCHWQSHRQSISQPLLQ